MNNIIEEEEDIDNDELSVCNISNHIHLEGNLARRFSTSQNSS